MASTYVQEPDTSGKVILITNYGELEIELWCKEIPKACKNFMQLCLEGYYDNTIFHRLIPGFMIQGGDPTNTGEGGESIYGEAFPTETHTRLRFNHRGMLAMANSKPHDNRSQFFITFDSCNWLDRKHSIFGKIAGDTIYNLMSMQHVDTDAEDRPTTPIILHSAKVIINPIEDLIPRQLKKITRNIEESNDNKVLEKVRPIKKKAMALLSFQNEEEEDINDDGIPKKIISSHDVINDSKFSKNSAVNIEELEINHKNSKLKEEKKEDFKKKIKKNEIPSEFSKANIKDKSLPASNEEIMKDMKVSRDKRTGRLQIVWNKEKGRKNSNDSSISSSSSSEKYSNEEAKEARKRIKEEYENLKLEAIRFKTEKEGSYNEARRISQSQNKKLLSTLEARRLRFLENRKYRIKEDEIVSKLMKFRKTLNSDIAQESWMNNKLKFHIDSARAYSNQEKRKNLIDKEHEKDDFEVAHRKAQEENRESGKFSIGASISLKEMIEEEPKDLHSLFNGPSN